MGVGVVGGVVGWVVVEGVGRCVVEGGLVELRMKLEVVGRRGM